MGRNSSSSVRRPGARVTLKDVAQRANVGVSTVSMALADRPNISPKTKRRIRDISR